MKILERHFFIFPWGGGHGGGGGKSAWGGEGKQMQTSFLKRVKIYPVFKFYQMILNPVLKSIPSPSLLRAAYNHYHVFLSMMLSWERWIFSLYKVLLKHRLVTIIISCGYFLECILRLFFFFFYTKAFQTLKHNEVLIHIRVYLNEIPSHIPDSHIHRWSVDDWASKALLLTCAFLSGRVMPFNNPAQWNIAI